MKFINIIDPVHGFIKVNKTEIEIIDNYIFQRLRMIKQLSGAHLIYPSALHSRFEHSLGVLHIANCIANTLCEKGTIDYDEIQNIRLAALLHDIGHGPFSHLFEEILLEKENITHEIIGKNIILKSEIGDIISSNGFDKNHISEIAFGSTKLPFISEIISGALSADIMDYLLRDGYFTGAEHAKIDHRRIISSLYVHNKKLALERSAIYSFESMMYSRYQMFKTVYFHKTVRSAEVMLLNAIKLAYNELGLDELTINKYTDLTDDLLLLKLLTLPNNNKLTQSKTLAENYRKRILLKCVFENTFDKKNKIKTNELIYDISEKAKVNSNEIFIDRSITSSMPLTPSKKEYNSIILLNKHLKAKKVLISEIPLVSVLTDPMNILRIYTLNKNKKKVEIAVCSIFNVDDKKKTCN